ncbi:hypothetical protein FIM10_10090 [Sphingomonadales bacterium 56]|jgi:hypothetical protein|uniref:hypothetical protein n=1 Tax=Sphingobium sp. S6 TaxID=2758386 RepID=UPI0019198493|nr:hypothetical protein [Sphingobium sp. S6]MBY2929025.1 hypothetical protein [Sphingomonadales bacterium 56]MBY2959123.1 hypothetical protein [Sphingomonadales bacterium 58]CAD7338367.1 hypothetical protein SPHS6_02040 [Sphingobium sp. S6]CAD7338602.1 hypothetical protein SPHS8_02072 [Sphingobium sp. S8]
MQDHRQSKRKTKESLIGSLMLLSFGVAVLAFLVAIDRPEWFELRPGSGIAAAMFSASARP